MNKIIYTVLLFAAFIIISCYPRRTNTASTVSSDADSSIIVSPAEAIKGMLLEEGFETQLVASEPFVSTPVAMNFDDQGRIWVVEMEGYMTDIEGSEEGAPTGKIVILEDRNKDGVIDKRNIFMDSLVLPRALCLVEGGILVAEPPRLWYVEIINDKPGRKTLVDDAYTEGGNVEAQANGLFRAMDNWIYSGGSDKRYRKSGDTWLVEKTHLRGQWGITQDDYGRLYYNNNSQNLLGDYFSPGLGAGNENMQRVKGFNERLIADNRVYPGWPTPGVNRGYKENVLDSLKRLVSFTAACGPALYRAPLFGDQYYNNVFVAEPAANLIKRNVLESRGFITEGRQAYQGKEFLVSKDERFRPVSLYTGPDGALYVVDMYRGIIQHKSFLTEYLKGEIRARSLVKPVNCGRIYRIVPKGSSPIWGKIADTPARLIEMLTDQNGWMRDKAQQMIIDGKHIVMEDKLRGLLSDPSQPLAAIHALWSLEGLGRLTPDDVQAIFKHTDWRLKAQALAAMGSAVDRQNYLQYSPILNELAGTPDTLIAPDIAYLAGKIQSLDNGTAHGILASLAQKYPRSPYVSDALISTLKGKENGFYLHLLKNKPDTTLLVYAQLRKVISDTKSNEKNRDVNILRKEFPRGASLFRTTCQPCHGVDGNGIPSLAPPLNKSEWVTGDKNKLILIILYGLTGPVTVNNKVYQAPEINGDMPGIGNNTDIVDEDIAQLASFIRRSWSNTAEKVSREDVIAIRKKFSGRQPAFTESELNQVFK